MLARETRSGRPKQDADQSQALREHRSPGIATLKGVVGVGAH
jgi:hypothetical protein